ncbi:MAG: hypothetical protein IKL62_01255 [Clostridia bacterium]|nr:hypothetical protein [Clostridia bacterium]
MDQCEHCAYYSYDETSDQYVCDAACVLDEDDIARFSQGRSNKCPAFRFYDEYKLVQKQN